MKVNISKYYKTSDRKIEVKIDRSDTFGADHTLAYIALPMLLQLKQRKMGIPAEIAEVGGGSWNQQTYFDFYQESYNQSFEKATEKWDEILDKMIWSFMQIIIDDYTELYHHGTSKYIWKETEDLFLNPLTNQKEKMVTMVDANPEEHWTDYVGMRLHEQRINEGLELFGKYFSNLWE